MEMKGRLESDHMNGLNEFMTAAGPWLVLGLLLAVLFAQNAKKKTNDEEQEDCGLLGRLIGMSLGSALSLATDPTAITLSSSMFIGFMIGTWIKKEKTKKQ